MTRKLSTRNETLVFGYIGQFETGGYARCGERYAKIIEKVWQLMYDEGLTDQLWKIRKSDYQPLGDTMYESYLANEKEVTS